MTDREMEARLAAALERTAPDDVEAVLARCGAQTGAVVPLPGQGGGQSGKQKKRWVPLAVAVEEELRGVVEQLLLDAAPGAEGKKGRVHPAGGKIEPPPPGRLRRSGLRLPNLRRGRRVPGLLDHKAAALPGLQIPLRR